MEEKAALESEMSVKAIWHSPGSSTRWGATLLISSDGSVSAVRSDGETISGKASNLKISDRVGNIPRRVSFPGGVFLLVSDNDKIDKMLNANRLSLWARFQDYFERNLVSLCALAVAAVVLGWFMFDRGLPWLGNFVVDKIPFSMERDLAEKAYNLMVYEEYFERTELSDESIDRVHDLFSPVAESVTEMPLEMKIHRYQVNDKDVPNAFAFPGGILLVTDRLVEVIDDEELEIIMAHEAGHAVERHSLKQIFRGVLLAGIVGYVTGDIYGIVTVPLVLDSLSYSRQLEADADCYAFRYAEKNGLQWEVMGSALGKLEKIAEEDFGFDGSEDQSSWLNYLSTHPPTESRSNPENQCAE